LNDEKSTLLYAFEKAVDLSHHLRNGMPVYLGDPSPSFESYRSLEKDGVNLTKLVMGSHTGTHLDAPKHFIQNGIGIDEIPLEKLIGESYIADFSRKPIGSSISADDLRDIDRSISSDDIVVFYTGCSEHWNEDAIRSNYTYLTADAAEYLVSKKVRAVGIDFLSVERFKAPEPVVHRTLLGNGIFIIESLSNALKQFVGKRILMICLPLKLKNGDGAPSRVIGVPIENGP
jgi:arylformamidase